MKGESSEKNEVQERLLLLESVTPWRVFGGVEECRRYNPYPDRRVVWFMLSTTVVEDAASGGCSQKSNIRQ